MITFKQFLEESSRREQINKLFEDCNPKHDGMDKKQSGQKQHRVDKNDTIFHSIQNITRECQINPEDDNTKIDRRILIWDIHKVEDGPYIINFGGGTNGGGDDKKWVTYFALVKKVVKKIQEEFKHVWMLDWANDCLDDVWTLRICVDPEDDKNKLHENKQTYVMKYSKEPDLNRVISKFWDIRHRLNAPHNDIDFWIKKPFKSLKNFVDSFDERNQSQKKSDHSKDVAEENGAKLLGNRDGYEIWYVPSYEAAIQLGRFYKCKSSKWCISSEDPSYWFENHVNSEFVFLIREKPQNDENDKIAVEFEDGGRYFNVDNIRTWNIDNDDEETFFNDDLLQYAWELFKQNGESRKKWYEEDYM